MNCESYNSMRISILRINIIKGFLLILFYVSLFFLLCCFIAVIQGLFVVIFSFQSKLSERYDYLNLLLLYYLYTIFFVNISILLRGQIKSFEKLSSLETLKLNETKNKGENSKIKPLTNPKVLTSPFLLSLILSLILAIYLFIIIFFDNNITSPGNFIRVFLISFPLLWIYPYNLLYIAMKILKDIPLSLFFIASFYILLSPYYVRLIYMIIFNK